MRSISTLALWGLRAISYFDNIQIWHTPPGATAETLLYKNAFTSRTVCPQGRKEGLLIAGTLKKDFEGQDFWRRAHIGTITPFLTDGSNPALSFKDDNGQSGYALHELGRTVEFGVIVAQADIRPPRGWLQKDGSVYLRYGGDKHFLVSFNNDVAANESFLRWTAAGFGFKNINSSLPRVAGLVTNVTLVAWNGDRSGGGAMQAAVMTVPVDVTHWYRFIAKMDLKNSLYDVVAYDMGAEQPTLATATPSRFSSVVPQGI